MPQVIFSPAALRDLQRLRDFLRPKNADAARRAGETIRQGVKALGTHPTMGRTIEDLPEQFREWLIDFGNSGYIARYHVEADTVTILALRHQKEMRFTSSELPPSSGPSR
jgi:plasmid stabilization system protein ParE